MSAQQIGILSKLAESVEEIMAQIPDAHELHAQLHSASCLAVVGHQVVLHNHFDIHTKELASTCTRQKRSVFGSEGSVLAKDRGDEQ